MESGFWEWLIRDSDEKSVRRELVEIGLLYLIFLGIMFFVDDVPLRWVLVAFAAGVVLFWESGREFLRIGLLAAVIVFGAVRPFVIQAFYIPSRSMENTLLVNDHIFVNKFIYYFKNPDRWDVIVFEYPNNPNKDYIKRLVGLPVDTAALSDHRLSINGRPVRKNYLHSETEIQFLKKPKPLSADGPPELLRFRGDAIGINQQIFMKEESVRNPVRMNMSILKVYREAGDHHVKEVHVNGTGRDSRLSDNFGPVKVPQKGETVDLTSLNGSELNFYFRLISRGSYPGNGCSVKQSSSTGLLHGSDWLVGNTER